MPGSSPAAMSWSAMYSVARRPPRVAGARPSSRSDDRKRRSPVIWAAVMAADEPDEDCAAAEKGNSTSAASSETGVRVMVQNLTDGYLGREEHAARAMSVQACLACSARGAPCQLWARRIGDRGIAGGNSA